MEPPKRGEKGGPKAAPKRREDPKGDTPTKRGWGPKKTENQSGKMREDPERPGKIRETVKPADNWNCLPPLQTQSKS